MKTALLMNAQTRRSVITDHSMEQLSSFGHVALNQTSGSDPDTIREVIRDADIAVTSWGNGSLTEDILNCAPDLKLVVHAAGSVKPVVSDALFDRGIALAGCAVVLSRGVAETALGFTISAAKNFYQLNQLVHEGGWAHDRKSITELFDITVGVVGCGYAGAHYIELLQSFEISILAYDPYQDEARIKALGAEKASLEQVLRESDILSLHAPSVPATHHMINARTLALLKDDVILINTARGSLIDEQALFEHMRSGKIKYACLDVTDPEPPAADHPLRTLPNCIITPHLAGQANNGLGRIGVHVCAEISRFLSGEPLTTQITRDMLSTIA